MVGVLVDMGGVEWVFNHCGYFFCFLKQIKTYFWHENVRSVEQSIVTIGIHLSSLELWQQDNPCINSACSGSLTLKASRDPVQKQHASHVNQEEAKRCSQQHLPVLLLTCRTLRHYLLHLQSQWLSDGFERLVASSCCAKPDLSSWRCRCYLACSSSADLLLTARMTGMKGSYPNPWWGEEGQSSASCLGKMPAALEPSWHL